MCLVVLVVSLYIFLLIITMRCAEMAELIEIPFGVWTFDGPRNRAHCWELRSFCRMGTFGGHTGACQELSVVDVLRLTR